MIARPETTVYEVILEFPGSPEWCLRAHAAFERCMEELSWTGDTRALHEMPSIQVVDPIGPCDPEGDGERGEAEPPDPAGPDDRVGDLDDLDGGGLGEPGLLDLDDPPELHDPPEGLWEELLEPDDLDRRDPGSCALDGHDLGASDPDGRHTGGSDEGDAGRPCDPAHELCDCELATLQLRWVQLEGGAPWEAVERARRAAATAFAGMLDQAPAMRVLVVPEGTDPGN